MNIQGLVILPDLEPDPFHQRLDQAPHVPLELSERGRPPEHAADEPEAVQGRVPRQVLGLLKQI